MSCQITKNLDNSLAISSHISSLIASHLLLFIVFAVNNSRENVGQGSFALYLSNHSSVQREGVKGQQLGLLHQH